jgi:hypothetical protein
MLSFKLDAGTRLIRNLPGEIKMKCFNPVIKILSLLLFIAAMGIAIIPDIANACPAGTRFSGFGENCYIGSGKTLKIIAQCRRTNGNCPGGQQRHESNKDPGVFYCCPSTSQIKLEKCLWIGTAPMCEGGTCPKGYRLKTISKTGDGKACVTGVKVRCCKSY